MALDDATKAEILELLKGSGTSGMSKDEITEMFNGLDKKQKKENEKLQQSLDSLGGFAKAFEGIKPKKLMKAMKKMGKAPKEPKPGEEGKTKPEEQQQQQSQTPTGELKNPYKFAKSKKLQKLADEVKDLKVANENERKTAHEVKRVAAIQVLMSGLQWVKPEAQSVVFEKYKERVTLDDPTGKLMFKLEDGDFAEFTKEFLTEDVQNRFDFALKPPEAGGSGIMRVDGRKPGTITLDDDLTDKDKSDAYAKALSKLLPAA
jgi:hypothetical protein